MLGMTQGTAWGSISDFGIGEAPAGPTNVTVDYASLFTTLAVLVGVMALVILLLIFITANLVNLVRVREGKEAYTFGATLAKMKEYALNPYIAAMGTLVVAVVGISVAAPIMRNVGHSKDYMPEQPIWFSHKIHAGTYEIDCQYCHTGASKGKNAWIPAVSVCMNCHKGIQEGAQTGTKEIAKIYEAYNNNVPIEWVRVHSLPDLAYFNHQQHVVAGKVECEECHGKIKEMDVVYQFNTLSMGWCINCHRTKEVDAKLYEKLGRDDVHTPADQGGLECARCHY
jgi:Cytochrome c7 and related cytochrome c/Class III cytochrome C family